jgi:hypothetical protein
MIELIVWFVGFAFFQVLAAVWKTPGLAIAGLVWPVLAFCTLLLLPFIITQIVLANRSS